MTCPCCDNGNRIFVGSKDSHDLYRCTACSLIYVDPMPSNEELSLFYQNYHKTTQYTGKLDSKLRRAKKRIRLVKWRVKGRRFVDVGCNVGFAVEAARRLGLESLGIDIDESSIRLGKSLFPEAMLEIMSVQELAASGSTFDLIYCSEVIEHLLNPVEFVEALSKILNNNGVLFLTTPDIDHFSLPEDILSWDGVRPPEHLLYFSKKSLNALLGGHGFGNVRFQFNLKPTLKVYARKSS